MNFAPVSTSSHPLRPSNNDRPQSGLVVQRLLTPPEAAQMKIDKSYIRNAEIEDPRSSRTRVNRHHQQLFDVATGSSEATSRREAEHHHGAAEQAIKALKTEQTRLDRLLPFRDDPEHQPDATVSFWDALQIFLYAVFLVALVVGGWAALSMLLVTEGFIDSLYEGAVYYIVPPAVALVLHLLAGLFGDVGRRRYELLVGLIGVVAGLVWIYLAAITFGSPPPANNWEPPEETISPLLLLLIFGLVAEAFLGASVWLRIDGLVHKWFPRKMIQNQHHVDQSARVREAEVCNDRLCDLERDATAKKEAFAAAREVYCGRAIAFLRQFRADRLFHTSHPASDDLPNLIAPSPVEDEDSPLFDSTPPPEGIPMNGHALSIVILLLALLLLPTAHAGTLVLGLSDTRDEEHTQTIQEAIDQVFNEAEPGTQVLVFDANQLQRLSRFTIPEGSARARSRKLAPARQEIGAFFARTRSVRDRPVGELHLPQFLALVASTIGRQDESTAVIVFGAPIYSDERDRAAVFGKGEVPGDGHVNAEPGGSIFATHGVGDPLAGVTVHFVHLGHTFDSELERRAIQRFWHVYIHALGGTLSTFTPETGTAIERAVQGISDAVTNEELDTNDHAIVMKRISDQRRVVEDDAATAPPQDPAPEPAEPQAQTPQAVAQPVPSLAEARTDAGRSANATIAALDEEDAIGWGQPVDLVVLIDASESWVAIQPRVHAAIEAAAAHLPTYSPRVRIAVVPFRDQPLTRFPLTRIRPDASDDGASRESLGTFLGGIEAARSVVDVEAAVTQALGQLEEGENPGRVVLCVITDQDPRESNPQDTGSVERVATAVADWAAGSENHRVVSVYVGNEPDGSQAMFLKRLAGGDRNHYADDVDAIVSTILTAALKK